MPQVCLFVQRIYELDLNQFYHFKSDFFEKLKTTKEPLLFVLLKLVSRLSSGKQMRIQTWIKFNFLENSNPESGSVLTKRKCADWNLVAKQSRAQKLANNWKWKANYILKKKQES